MSTLAPAAGTIRFNHTTQALEVYIAAGWQTVVQAIIPKTWREWLDYHTEELIDHGSLDHKLLYVRNEMQERFPGNYTIKYSGEGVFELDFLTPQDQTAFLLRWS